MSGLVIDASVALAWCLPDEASDFADKILERVCNEEAVVPALWWFEVSNGLRGGLARKRISSEQVREAEKMISRLPVFFEPMDMQRGMTHLALEAHALGLSAYDAAYFLLAERKGLPLATGDKALAKAARSRKIKTLTP